MAKVNTKRQVTLPVAQCILADINAGDSVDYYVDRVGTISIVKHQASVAKDFLKAITVNTSVSE